MNLETIEHGMRMTWIALSNRIVTPYKLLGPQTLHKHLINLSAVLLLLFLFGCFQTTEVQDKCQQEPNNAAQLVELAKAHLDVKEYAEARRTLTQAINADPSNTQAYKWLALTLREILAKGYDEKIYKDADYRRNLTFEGYRALDKAIRLTPQDSELRLLRGIAGVKMPFFVRKLERGIDDLNRVLESDAPDSTKAEALYWLGEAYKKKAMSHWIKVITKDPNSAASQAVFDRMRPSARGFDFSQHQPPVLTIHFILGFQDELEPQTAVWIEDREGNFVKTIYVSGFSGHAKEKQVRLPKWANSSKFLDVDGVTGASIDLGPHIYVWDLKDALGRNVEPGEYVVKVEINYWPSMQYQLVSAPINVGQERDQTVVEEGNFVPYLEVNYSPL